MLQKFPVKCELELCDSGCLRVAVYTECLIIGVSLNS